jgi:hypothetical protein
VARAPACQQFASSIVSRSTPRRASRFAQVSQRISALRIRAERLAVVEATDTQNGRIISTLIFSAPSSAWCSTGEQRKKIKFIFEVDIPVSQTVSNRIPSTSFVSCLTPCLCDPPSSCQGPIGRCARSILPKSFLDPMNS